ncbi:hypothetical protein ACFTAO_11185 [Paenibacillus rhizoplanae]
MMDGSVTGEGWHNWGGSRTGSRPAAMKSMAAAARALARKAGWCGHAS